MATFKVSYEIDIEGVGCAEEAAWAAWAILRAPGLTRAVFEVIKFDSDGIAKQIVVDEDDDESERAVADDDGDDADSITCRKCSVEYAAGGDGYDGLCPDCADRAFGKSRHRDDDELGWRPGVKDEGACPVA